MFTGIIETVGTVLAVRVDGTNKHFRIASSISHELKVDQSLSHDGVCLTVVAVGSDSHSVVAVQETIGASTLGNWQEGTRVNLERSMMAGGRFDGHIVQGHVDQTGVCSSVNDENGSWLLDFEYEERAANVTVEKGSIAVNGVSLTCFRTAKNRFTVSIIPYTYDHTNFQQLRPGTKVNLEFDVIGKYVKRLMSA